ncbi:MAG TPA: carboxypeptidase M32 [Planctomycetales bacterium]|jgi:carboxypeptidase Taq|nr:carboxypeptidase M32 [Planctomycetales bacterium]
MKSQAAYDELVRLAQQRALLGSCTALLAWDEETYMPRGGAALRADQLAYLAGLEHEKATNARISDLLAEVDNTDLVSDPLSDAAVNVREWRRLYARLTRLPQPLIEEIARVTSLAQQEWAAARQAADFARFLPWLDRVVALKRREADALGYEIEPYDALLDEYEPGARGRDLDALFAVLSPQLTALTERLTAAPRRPNDAVLRRAFPTDRQRVFNKAAATTLGFDFEGGRLDDTTHPFFAAIGPGDCRITTRYNLDDFGDAFFSTLHEVGHGLYEQGLDPTRAGLPVGEAPSLALHESQSRLWENTVGRGLAFWQHFFPLARQVFPEALGDVSLAEFHFAVNRVEPSLIRVKADEATYNLHILVRFELERALISGDLRAADVPAAWNEAYRRRLGVAPDNDAEGCLQDGHWAAGLIGYFPTYTLGNVIAAQLYARAEEELGDLAGAFAHGDFSPLLGWLRNKIYHQGGRYPTARLIELATGVPPDARPFVAALRHKYEELYGL